MPQSDRPVYDRSESALESAVAGLLRRVDERIGELFDDERGRWLDRHPEIAPALDTLQSAVLVGGKRLRPQFAFHGFVAAGGEPREASIVDLACSLELLHAFALIHDDVMDESAMRRHRPSVHEEYRRRHVASHWAGDAARTSESFAILLGDLAFAWSVRFELDLPRPVRAELDRIRTELHVGQYLDLASAATRSRDQHTARSIATYKTARYTVTGPLLLGAELAGGERPREALARYGDAVGEAFQHRDDLLGVFGDPIVTGKPRYDDLYAGKSTLLLHYTLERACDDPSVPLDRLGTDELTESDAAAVAAFMCASGAVAALESRIDELIADAVAALEAVDLPDESRAALVRLAHVSGSRQS